MQWSRKGVICLTQSVNRKEQRDKTQQKGSNKGDELWTLLCIPLGRWNRVELRFSIAQFAY